MSETFAQRSIGKDAAIAMVETEWWKGVNARTAFEFQMNTAELAMPFDEFQRVAEEALGRSVWTHEFAFPQRLMDEFNGDKKPATFEEILALIPAEKRILVTV